MSADADYGIHVMMVIRIRRGFTIRFVSVSQHASQPNLPFLDSAPA